MNQANVVHPDPEQLAAFGQGRLDPESHAEIARHVADCEVCTGALWQVPDDSLMGRLRLATTTGFETAALTPSGQPAGQGAAPEPPAELRDHPRYRIVQCLGAGAMGVVYQAEHRLMERLVALKVIAREWTKNANAVERFRQEARAAARLDHPNIVRAFDAEQAGDVHFLVMEYIDGANLARLVDKKGPLPTAHACRVAWETALGLQHAFEKGMVHRDVKPHNLMLTRQGQVKILDFGLARLAREQESDAPMSHGPSREKSALTVVGMVLGTPDYIAPEQARDARGADARSDLYSLGCTLYFLLSGQPPYPGGTAVEKMLRHQIEEPRPLPSLRADIPAAIWEIVRKLMAKDAALRYQTPAEAALALAPFLEAASPTGPLGSAAAPAMQPDDDGAPPPTAPPPLLPRTAPASPGGQGGKAGRRSSLLRYGVWAAAFVLGMIAAACSWVYLWPHGGAGEPARGGPRVLLAISHRGFCYTDYETVRRVLEEGGATVKVASTATGEATSFFDPKTPGLNAKPVAPDLLLSEAKAADYDVVVFAGGGRWTEFTGDAPDAEPAHKLIAGMLADGKYVAATGTGTAVLADADVLRGVKATGHSWVLKELVGKGARMVNEPFLVSGRIITGREQPDAEKFARALQQTLAAK